MTEPPGVPPVGVRVPASTANLGPGFDSFGIALGLHLEAHVVVRRGEEPRVATVGEGSEELPGDDENLLWRSFLALCAHVGAPVPDVGIRVHNGIALERGLGSSSAAIVAGLGLARAAVAATLSDLELVRLATEIEGHPDNVAPAVLGGLVVAARTDGGELVVRRAQPHPRLCAVVLVPESRQATVAARASIPASLDRAQVVDQTARAGHVIGALLGAWPAEAALVGDRLHEPARFEVMGPSGAVVGALREGGIHAWLSGAGPSVCAAVPRRDAGAVELCGTIGEEHGFAASVRDWDLSGLTLS
ncbi:MAG: homoserine kinase [Nitriliruptorales bacterium]